MAQALQYGRGVLADTESPDIDSQMLLCHVLECTTTYLHTWSEQVLNDEQQAEFTALIQQRSEGKPVAHLTGQRGFWSLDLAVTPDTLIPRPDTELLVTLALEKLRPDMRVVDLGTGTGAVVLSLAQENPTVTIFAMEYSRGALKVAKQNAQSHKLNNVLFWQGSWLTAVADNSLDMVVSNPPYIEADDPHLSQGDVQFEPLSALASGADGLDDIRQIVEQARRCLKASGWLMVEHGYHQATQVQQLFRDAGFVDVTSQPDYGGNDRVVMGKLAV
ncbi:MAG: peptide chain release factor N(5)-glutamine methyltransferase [Gammaproteobacteria bacterium]|nr:peptide chain release factor N(5)-glutamine methyltransferase [Gammaproteobacteria bacterium]